MASPHESDVKDHASRSHKSCCSGTGQFTSGNTVIGCYLSPQESKAVAEPSSTTSERRRVSNGVNKHHTSGSQKAEAQRTTRRIQEYKRIEDLPPQSGASDNDRQIRRCTKPNGNGLPNLIMARWENESRADAPWNGLGEIYKDAGKDSQGVALKEVIAVSREFSGFAQTPSNR